MPGDVYVAKNFRPVSLLPIVSRILEYFVKQQLTTYLSENGLFSESQFAYRRQRSTEDAVVLFINRWLTAKTERKYTLVVMVDMSKAFERVKHSCLIADLFSLGISGLALQWFCSYLSERSKQIKIGDNLSSSTACSRGVPQGSVLGPILFVIYIYTSRPCRTLFGYCPPPALGSRKCRHKNSLLLFPHSLPMSHGAQAAIKPRHHGRQSCLCPAPISFMP